MYSAVPAYCIQHRAGRWRQQRVIAHLWVMFASHGYFQGSTTNRLTPVYQCDTSGTGRCGPSLKADWSVMAGSGALPLQN